MKRSYKRIRNAANIVNNAPITTPCMRGNGNCCFQPNVPATSDDQDVIMAAIRDGKISKDIVERAIKRSFDPMSQGCPFLGDTNECTIYKYRPVICMMYGSGAGPVNRETLKEAIKRREYGADRGMRIPDVKPFLCTECFMSFNPLTVFPTLIVEKTLEVWDYIATRAREQKVLSLLEFVRQVVPNLSVRS